MKEIYDWVPWFRELAKNISEGGKEYLIERAKKVEWGENPALLRFGDEGIDPFSFFYFLASKARFKQNTRIFDSVAHVFKIETALMDMANEDYCIFPTPPQNWLFHDRSNFSPDLLWRLFTYAAEENPDTNPLAFKNVMGISNVAIVKLSQTLFLINPNYFQPVDNLTDDLSDALDLRRPTELQRQINESGGFEEYRVFLQKLSDAFPRCEPYEINMFLDLQKPKVKNRIRVSDRFYQVSTFVDNPAHDDYWENRDDSFKENYWVYTGDQFPKLTEPKPGDIMLVRTGIQKGRAIGVVYKNDYAEHGRWTDNGRIHVLWINKSECELPEGNVRQQSGFSQTHTRGVYSLFEKTDGYRNSIDLIETLRDGSIENETEPDPATITQMGQDPRIHPLNQILYGPPGTSKTWHTVNHALAIIDNKPLVQLEKESEEVRKGKLRRFNELKKNGQIDMVTFHQNYNYEDFIEGIRPVLAGDGEGRVEYELSEGVFRQISERAEENVRRSGQTEGESWDIDELLQAFAKSIDDKLVSDEPIDLFPPDRKRVTRIVKVNWSRDGIFKSVNAGTEKSWRYLTRDVIKEYYIPFYSGEIRSEKVIRPTRKSKQTQHSHAHYYYALFEKIREFHDEEWQPDEHGDIEPQNHVLIIDEINRGNIAKIFGELITLIEDSKRTGGNDPATVTLPYSKEEFGVPDNLYIIGTMNTADRSIALLDTALRRRFHFVEMMPDPKLVPEDIHGVNCQKLLEAMNNRIRFLLDREHQIGHTYLMNVKSIDSLASTFKNKIVPLLQEYFYDNWEKIDLVLNRNGFIRKITIESGLFKESDLIDDQSESYELAPARDDRWRDPESYRAIYEQAKSGSEQGS